MSNTPVIRAEHLGKRYVLGARQRSTGSARDAIAGAVKGLFSRLRPSKVADSADQILWALDDVSFEVQPGETIGIIGRNGAGKSTLLKVLSQITEPTTGFAEVTGRVGSLLEVGTGFHADLTGRENTYLNGAILGMKRKEIDRKFDEIVAFAEVDRFIDTPVKFYSSGMYMRLAFAVAAHLETEILVVDEVLAVGDVQFQQKCLGKMDDIAKHGRTVLFISHNMEAIQRLCTRGLLMERGRLVASGSVAEVVARYRAEERKVVNVGQFNSRGRTGTGWARVADAALVDAEGRRAGAVSADRDLVFDITLEVSNQASAQASLRGLLLHLVVGSDEGQPLLSLMNVGDSGLEIPSTNRCTLRARLKAPTFIPGRYYLNVFLGIPYLEHVDYIPQALDFEITAPEQPWRPYSYSKDSGVICRIAEWNLEGAGQSRDRIAVEAEGVAQS